MRTGKLSTVLTVLFAIMLVPAVTAQESSDTDPELVQYLDASGESFIYYSFAEDRAATAEEVENGMWDIGFKGTDIRVNGRVQVLDASFEEVAMAPELGYEVDEPQQPAIPNRNGQGWFNYDAQTHIVTPIKDRTIVIATAHDTYAKVEILDYYKPNMNLSGNGPTETPRFYTFRYVHPDDGSRTFSEASAP